MNISSNLSYENSTSGFPEDVVERSEPGWFVYWGVSYIPAMRIYGIFIVVLASFGIVGNCFSMFVYSRKEMSTVGTFLLFHLAIPDNLYLITIIILDGMMWLNPAEDFVDHVAIVCQSVLAPVSFIVYMVEIYITVALAVQRCILVTSPIRARSLITKNILRLVVVGIYVVSVLYNVPHVYAFAPEAYFEPYLNRTWLRPKNTEFFFSKPYRTYYSSYGNLIVRGLIPIIILSVSSGIIIFTLCRRSFKDSQKAKRDGSKVTFVVLAVTFMSLISHTTSALQWLAKYAMFSEKCGHLCFVWGRCANALIVLNCVSNFIFYCSFGKKFRSSVQSLFSRTSSSSVMNVT